MKKNDVEEVLSLMVNVFMQYSRYQKDRDDKLAEMGFKTDESIFSTAEGKIAAFRVMLDSCCKDEEKRDDMLIQIASLMNMAYCCGVMDEMGYETFLQKAIESWPAFAKASSKSKS